MAAGESLGRAFAALGRAMRLSYDHLGLVLAASIQWFVVGLIPAIVTVTALTRLPSLITLAVAGVALVFLTGPSFTAAIAVARGLSQGEEVPLSRFWQEYRRFLSRSAGVHAVGLVLVIVMVADLMYFVRSSSAILRALSGLWVWGIVYAIAVFTMAPSVLVYIGHGVRATLKQTALVVLDNVVVVGITGLALLVLLALSVVLAAPLMLLFAGMAAFVLSCSTDAIIERYRQVDGGRGRAEGPEGTKMGKAGESRE